jgi:hypothetical protein
MANENKAVTTIISATTKHTDQPTLTPALSMQSENRSHQGATGALHQDLTRDAEFADRVSVEALHLGGRHERPDSPRAS